MLLYSFKLSMYYHTYDIDKNIFMMLTRLNISLDTMATLYHFGIALILLSDLLTFFIFTPRIKYKYALISPIAYYVIINNPATNYHWFIATQTSVHNIQPLFTAMYIFSNMIVVLYMITPIVSLIYNTVHTRIINSKRMSIVFTIYFLTLNILFVFIFFSEAFINPNIFKIELNEYFIPRIDTVNIESFPIFLMFVFVILTIFMLLTRPFNYFIFNRKNLLQHNINKFRNNSYFNLKMIFHKYKNIFAAIEKFSQLGVQHIDSKQTKATEIFETIENISKDSLSEISQIISSIDNEFEIKPVITDVFECVEGALRLSGIPRESIAINNEVNFEHKIYCDKTLLVEAISNILKNAEEGSADSTNKPIQVDIFNELNFVVINITDFGCGISKKNLRHIFKPFFSTKSGGNNQGLGLAFTKKIINLHNGMIYVKSKTNHYTTFQIVLPIKQTNAFWGKGSENYAI